MSHVPPGDMNTDGDCGDLKIGLILNADQVAKKYYIRDDEENGLPDAWVDYSLVRVKIV